MEIKNYKDVEVVEFDPSSHHTAHSSVLNMVCAAVRRKETLSAIVMPLAAYEDLWTSLGSHRVNVNALNSLNNIVPGVRVDTPYGTVTCFPNLP